MNDQTKIAGRPRKRPHLGARLNVMFRLNASVRDRVIAEADAEGRSLSEMLERIVDLHFQRTDMRSIVREEIAASQRSVSQLNDAPVRFANGITAHYGRPAEPLEMPPTHRDVWHLRRD